MTGSEPSMRSWWRFSERAAAVAGLAALLAFVLIASLAPFLSHDLPIRLDGRSPLWRAMTRLDVLWLAASCAPALGWLTWKILAVLRRSERLCRRGGALAAALVAVASAVVAADKDEYHETRRYRAERDLRRELHRLDERVVVDPDPSREQLGEFLAAYLDLHGRSYVALSLSPEIEERIRAFQDGRGAADRRAHIRSVTSSNEIELTKLEAAWFPLNAHAPERPSLVRMTRPGESARHALGTDFEGRDLVAQLIWATRTALTVALATTALSALIALVAGGLAGSLGGPLDWLLSRVIETVACLPTPFMLVIVAAYLPSELRARTESLVLILALFAWPHGARLVRIEARRLRNCDFVVAARGLGASRLGVTLRHVLPNACTPLLVHSSLLAASIVVTESTLGFLGLGVNGPSWGKLLHRARFAVDLEDAWHLAVLPGAAVFAVTLTFNVLGEELRRARDPRG